VKGNPNAPAPPDLEKEMSARKFKIEIDTNEKQKERISGERRHPPKYVSTILDSPGNECASCLAVDSSKPDIPNVCYGSHVWVRGSSKERISTSSYMFHATMKLARENSRSRQRLKVSDV